MKLSRLKAAGLLLLVLLLLASWVYAWETRRGCFSYTNYTRIEIGMTLGQVHSLLGTTGEMVDGKYIPTGVVKGEHYWKWGSIHDGYIVLGVTGDRVTGKHYWVPSL